MAEASALSGRRLTRSPSKGRVAGVCAGLADYFDVDVVLIRVAWAVLSVVPGAIIGGVLAYLAAWLIMPERHEPVIGGGSPRRLTRSRSDRKVAGVCGGLAEYLGVDATPVRLLWLILTILPGAFVGGLLAYVVAWIIMPAQTETTLVPTTI